MENALIIRFDGSRKIGILCENEIDLIQLSNKGKIVLIPKKTFLTLYKGWYYKINLPQLEHKAGV